MKTTIKMFMVIMFLTSLLVTVSFASPLYIYSDNTWKSYSNTKTDITDWETLNFDDSGWRDAYAPYPNSINGPGDWIPDTPSSYIWDWSKDGVPNGANGPNEAWFRKDFYLNWDPTYIQEATITINADDRFDLYINGTNLLTNQTGVSYGPYGIDIMDYLLEGNNVIAVHAWDGYDQGPENRVYEWLLVEGKITPVPEPATIILLGFGLLGAGIHGRRKFRK